MLLYFKVTSIRVQHDWRWSHEYNSVRAIMWWLSWDGHVTRPHATAICHGHQYLCGFRCVNPSSPRQIQWDQKLKILRRSLWTAILWPPSCDRHHVTAIMWRPSCDDYHAMIIMRPHHKTPIMRPQSCDPHHVTGIMRLQSCDRHHVTPIMRLPWHERVKAIMWQLSCDGHSHMPQDLEHYHNLLEFCCIMLELTFLRLIE